MLHCRSGSRGPAAGTAARRPAADVKQSVERRRTEDRRGKPEGRNTAVHGAGDSRRDSQRSRL